MSRRLLRISARGDDNQSHVGPLLVTTKSFCGVPEKDFVALGTKLNGVGRKVVSLVLGLEPIHEGASLLHSLLQVGARKRFATQETSRQSHLSPPVLPSHLTMSLLDRDCSIPKLDFLSSNRILDLVTGTRIYAKLG